MKYGKVHSSAHIVLILIDFRFQPFHRQCKSSPTLHRFVLHALVESFTSANSDLRSMSTKLQGNETLDNLFECCSFQATTCWQCFCKTETAFFSYLQLHTSLCTCRRMHGFLPFWRLLLYGYWRLLNELAINGLGRLHSNSVDFVCRCCWTCNASLLFVWRHCERCLANGVNWGTYVKGYSVFFLLMAIQRSFLHFLPIA
jgi:hypothetical protein